ncbi:MAG: FAD-dependent oxidoreductase [Desulfarculaceae bacterium]|nr:FAD-dependent oxidoreductase [Desulfarculaceae bacterium]MCF8072537.1 FAD-dependent oxidoreductase [Desulfarculaceae bacterium]MCF8103440.1 FAD-dependent oxidoreductase [Desulfarculaceae bacterium]MCF8117078.1 FAD-dependent oxidoreductase [Desulfarculaceae bacterium]
MAPQAPSSIPHSLLERIKRPGLEDLDNYLAAGGFELHQLDPLSGVKQLRAAGLRRRTSPAEPVFHSWWSFCQQGGQGAMVVDARRRDTLSQAEDRLLGRDPYGLIEALYLAHLASGAGEALVLLDPSLAAHRPVLLNAMAELNWRGLPAGGAFELEVRVGSLFEAPAPDAAPRLTCCVETWYQIKRILTHPDLASAPGGEAGTRLITVGGAVNRSGLVEVSVSDTLGTILNLAGGLDPKVSPRALALDSGAGGFLPPEMTGLSLDPEEMMSAGANPGFGTLMAVGPERCLVELTRKALIRLAQLGEHPSEASRTLTWHAVRLIIQLALRRGGPETVEQLEAIAERLEGMNSPAAWPLTSSLRNFRDEWISHAQGTSCAALDCLRPLVAPCHATCPAGIDIPSFMALIGQGRYSEAVEVMRRDNPLSYICGLVCPAPCEKSCLRQELDTPISIRAMKAVACRHALEEDGGYPKPQAAPASGHKAAVVGGGPAGLTCAFFLALAGHQVTLFEAQEVMGGTAFLGIPAYRLPREVIAAEVEAIAEVGVEMNTGQALGRDFTLEDLRGQGYEAVFLGIGAHEGYRLGIPGEAENTPVHDAITFLREVSLGTQGAPAGKVVVVGGGNAAMDAARTCRRLGCEVTISYRRTRGEMPAHDEEIDDALAEGIDIAFLTMPLEVMGTGGKVTGLKCLRAELGPADITGRRRPQPVEGSEFVMEAGAIIAAISQRPDLACLGPWAQDENLCAKTVNADPLSGQTSLGWLYAGGDDVTGPATVVEAVAAGKRAALAMGAQFEGKTLDPALLYPTPRATVEPMLVEAEEKAALKRPAIPMLPPAERADSFVQAELGLTDEMALSEARRCLRCDVCIGCGLCQTACAEMGVGALQIRETPANRGALIDFHRAADRCIGCGACAAACPTGAIRLMDQAGLRKTTLAGTVLRELPLLNCDACGKPYVPQLYLDRVASRLSPRQKQGRSEEVICPECARRRQARSFAGRF